MFLTGFTSFRVLLFFPPLSMAFFVFMHGDAISSNIDEVL